MCCIFSHQNLSYTSSVITFHTHNHQTNLDEPPCQSSIDNPIIFEHWTHFYDEETQPIRYESEAYILTNYWLLSLNFWPNQSLSDERKTFVESGIFFLHDKNDDIVEFSFQRLSNFKFLVSNDQITIIWECQRDWYLLIS